MNQADFVRMQQESEHLIAVNSENEPLFPIEKRKAHQSPGVLHRAITVFLFSPDGKCLVTQRSQTKPLWPLWWDAACSTHQWWPQESALAAAQRRLPFEIGLGAQHIQHLSEQFHYEYHAIYNQEWQENEINFIITGTTRHQPECNSDEVHAYRWLTVKEIDAELANTDHRFAPWFALAWERIKPLLPIQK